MKTQKDVTQVTLCIFNNKINEKAVKFSIFDSE